MSGNTQSLKSPVLFQIRLNNANYSLSERIEWLREEMVHWSGSTKGISNLKSGKIEVAVFGICITSPV
jgi:hypothetical protein